MRITVVGLVACLLAGFVQPVAAEDAVPLDEGLLAGVAFGAAVRIKDPGPDYDKRVVLTAELLDWRARHPTASAAEVSGHAASVEAAVRSGFSTADASRSTPERLGRLLELTYAAPDAAVGGEQAGRLLGALAVRDMAPEAAVVDVTRRLSGAQQLTSVDVFYGHAQTRLWSALRGADEAVAQSWQGVYGKPTPTQPGGLDPRWTFDDLKKVAKLKELVDLDKLIAAAKLGTKELITEIGAAFTNLRFKLNEANGKPTELGASLEELLRKAGIPDRPNSGASQAEIARAFELEKKRRETIDGVKGALDVVATVAGMLDKKIGRYVATFAAAAYQVATAVSTIVTAAATLATSTAIGSTLGAYGAIAGAAVGLVMAAVQFFGGLSADDESAAQQVSQQLAQAVVEEIHAGFKQTNENLKLVSDRMDARFDRIDAGLNTIYRDMLRGFGDTMELLRQSDLRLESMHDRLLRLVAASQQFNQQLNQRLSELAGEPFLSTAYTYVDYEAKKHIPIPDYADYLLAADRFGITASQTARGPNFAYPGPPGDSPELALQTNGPAGAITYLAKLAASYGMPIPSTERPVANADLWAEAARAYTLLALQNPGYAKREIGAAEQSANGEIIAANGRAILATAQEFSKPLPRSGASTRPGTGPATNALFSGLLRRNQELTTALLDDLRDVEDQAHDPGRPLTLWSAADGWADIDVNRLAATADGPLTGVPDLAPKCGTSTGGTPTRAVATGRALPRSLLTGMYLDGQKVRYSHSCWTNATMGEATDVTSRPLTRRVCEYDPKSRGRICETIITGYQMTGTSPIHAEVQEWVHVEGVGAVLGRTVQAKGPGPQCRWTAPHPDGTAPAHCRQAQDAEAHLPQTTLTPVTETVHHDAAAPQVRAMLDERRAHYLRLVAAKLTRGELPRAELLEDNLRLLRAYTTLGFPRAVHADDTLRALLYGPAGLGMSPGAMADAYSRAATDLLAGRGVMGSVAENVPESQAMVDSGLSTCPATGLLTADPLAACVAQSARRRRDLFAQRLEWHFRGIRDRGVPQTLPMVVEALRNLELAQRHLSRKPIRTPKSSSAPHRKAREILNAR
ncbi:hypothetical protein [Nonomuraea lactucae]|uniref:hypothetical protein n=1 Tax=Nonomuraea lactucae TaxID=2249762 RepID=UPI000DE22A7E|nr:hypothetical protein [Nonomuraea lactucae]